MASKDRKKTFHWHGCRTCHARIGDNCNTPAEAPECRTCAVGAPRWKLLYENSLPKDCCIETSERIDPKSRDGKARMKTYDLAPSCTWYQCQLCRRTHPYDDPTKIRREGWGGPTRI